MNNVNKIKIACFGIIFIFACILIGCGRNDPRKKYLVPAAGTLYYKNEPVSDASITFFHEDPAKQGGGATTDSTGNFVLTTYSNFDGTLPGNYTVVVSKETIKYPISDEDILRYEREGKTIPPGKITNHLPVKYGDKETSDIIVSIPKKGGDKNIKIELGN